MQPQQQEWLAIAKNNLKANTIPKLYGRLERLEMLINKGVLSYGTRFVVDDTLRQTICSRLLSEIDEYSGTRKFAKGQEASLKDVDVNTRTWWNRRKSMVLGSHLFVVICFYILHHFITTQLKNKKITSAQALILFIDIFMSFMDDTIRFPKTKPKPLMVQRMFLHNGTFKHICARFIAIFGDENIQWDCYVPSHGPQVENGKHVTKYIKKSDRTQSLYQDFYECLKQIKNKYFVPNNDVETAMKEWTQYLAKSTPNEYNLSFYEVHDPHAVISDASSSVSVELQAPNTTNEMEHNRSFQNMNGFARNLTLHKQNVSVDDHSARREEYIQRMRASMNNNNNNSNNNDPISFNAFNSSEFNQFVSSERDNNGIGCNYINAPVLHEEQTENVQVNDDDEVFNDMDPLMSNNNYIEPIYSDPLLYDFDPFEFNHDPFFMCLDSDNETTYNVI